MLIVGLLMLMLGTTGIFAGLLLHVGRKSVDSFLSSIPRPMLDLVAESDPQVRRGLDLTRSLPKASRLCGGIGILIYFVGVLLLPNILFKMAAAALAIGIGYSAPRIGRRLTPLLQKAAMKALRKKMLE